jgi:hypothetical protein
MMLAIRPDLVKPFESLKNRDMGYSFEPAYRGGCCNCCTNGSRTPCTRS